MALDALTLSDDMQNIFLDSGFEENVTYTMSGQSARTVKAMVYRDGLTEVKGVRSSETRKYDTVINVSKDATDGIPTVTLKADSVTYFEKLSDSSTTEKRVAGIIIDDAGAWYLGLR